MTPDRVLAELPIYRCTHCGPLEAACAHEGTTSVTGVLLRVEAHRYYPHPYESHVLRAWVTPLDTALGYRSAEWYAAELPDGLSRDELCDLAAEIASGEELTR